jgi:ATP-binding cassette, subfamily C (CFTR/MRP), member 1
MISTNLLAKRLPYADHIVALDSNGCVSEQGDFKCLSAQGGYVSSFNLLPPEWNFLAHNPNKSEPSKEVVAPPTKAQVTEDDIGRRTGDVSIYLYYVNAVGWVPTLIFVFAICGFIFSMSFPSKQLLPKYALVLTSFQPYGLNGGLLQIRKRRTRD